ncbi:MAG TPA: peptidylprolyl isomerase [Polyangiaceae bacterium]
MADDKKNKPGSDSNPVDDGAHDVEGAAEGKRSTRDKQDSLFEDEGWEDADNGDEEEDSDESDGSEDDEESDDESDEDEESDEDDDDDESDEDDDDESGEDEDDDDESDEDEDDDDDESDEDDETDDWIPDWAPWAVLGGLLLLGLAGGFGLLTPNKPGEAVPSAADVAAPPSSEPATEAEPPRPVPTARADQGESISASHLLVAYSGAMRSKPGVTRTKEEAKARAEEALKKARKPGADFAKLVAEYSDEPNAAQRGGKLGSFTRNRMVKPFSDAAFELKVGEISDVVETGFGYHVILRTE